MERVHRVIRLCTGYKDRHRGQSELLEGGGRGVNRRGRHHAALSKLALSHPLRVGGRCKPLLCGHSSASVTGATASRWTNNHKKEPGRRDRAMLITYCFIAFFLCSLRALHDLLSWFSKEATEENGRLKYARKPSTQINSLSLQPGNHPRPNCDPVEGRYNRGDRLYSEEPQLATL